MQNKNKKITEWIAYSIIAIVFGLVAISSILFLVNSYYYGFKEDKVFGYKYLGIFNESYRKKIVSVSSWISRSDSHIDFYSLDSDEICVIELKRYCPQPN